MLSSSSDAQTLAPGKPTPASSPWFGTGYLWGEEETVDFAEVTPDSALSWGEKYVIPHVYTRRIHTALT